jgi:hypothetical protein
MKSDIGSTYQFCNDAVEEEHTPDKKKFEVINYDLSDLFVVNPTKIVKDGGMDDVFIIEKVS